MTRSLLCAIIAAAFVCGVALADPPAKAVAHYEKGLKLKRAGQFEQSAGELQAAVAAYPKYLAAHYALGWVYRNLGKNDAATESFREVIRLGPQTTEAVESAKAIQRIRLGAEQGPRREAPRIVFASERDGNVDLYTMSLDGADVRRITSDPAVDDSPCWSPDGARIAFTSERDGNREIYLINADGTGTTRVTDDPSVDDWPVWSPDGRRIAFESNRGGNMDVYVVSPDGTGLRQVTYTPSEDWMGSWSPNGRNMAILSMRDQVSKVHIINSDGTYPRRLVQNNVPEGRPVWAPAGEHVYFTWNFERNYQVCRSSLDGHELVNITRSPYDERLCDVSRDGRRLLVTSNRDGDQELHLVDVGTGAAVRLTHNPGSDRNGRFAP